MQIRSIHDLGDIRTKLQGGGAPRALIRMINEWRDLRLRSDPAVRIWRCTKRLTVAKRALQINRGAIRYLEELNKLLFFNEAVVH